MENQTSASNPVSGKEELDLKEKAYTHLAQGKRHLLVKDYYEAANSLAEACTFFDTLYGTGANECGEVYFNYGKALLELGRSESNVLGLGDNPDGKEEDSENSSDEDANENGEDEGETGGDVKSEEKIDDSEKTGESETKPDDGDPVSTECKMDAGGGTEDGEQEDEGDDNLKLAWEVLELAKTIFERQSKTDKQYELKLAEVYFKLCEVGLESGVYDQAIEDMKICVDIQKRNLRDDDRILAESFYELGVAYSLKNDYDVAIGEFNNAIAVLEKKACNLQEMLKTGVPAEVRDADPFYSIEGELKEVNELIPEIRDKISDLQDAKKETVRYIRDQLMKESSGEGAGCSNSSAPAPSATTATATAADATDISHLVRKKRKIETDMTDETCQKQSCTDKTVPDH